MGERAADRHDEPGVYRIRVEGNLDPARWAAWFDGLSLSREDDGTTVIHGAVRDQAALHGVLRKVRDVGLPLVSVTRATDIPTTDIPTTDIPTTDIPTPTRSSP